jgi:hypothetical protein
MEPNCCPICLEDSICLPFKLHCGHDYCFMCIKNYVLYPNKVSDQDAQCCLCRETMSDNDLYRLFHKPDHIKYDPETYSPGNVKWGYYTKDASAIWLYSCDDTLELEHAYLSFLKSDSNNLFILSTGCVNYEIDFISMTQTNPYSGRTRGIVRIEQGSDEKEGNIVDTHTKIIGVCGVPFIKN